MMIKVVKKFFSRLLIVVGMRKKHSKIYSIRHVNDFYYEGYNIVYKNCVLNNVKMGKYSYIGPNSRIVNTEIGAFTSIGAGLKILSGRHPQNEIISTHPIFYSKNYVGSFNLLPEFQEYIFLSNKNKISVSIGNDVWIGDNVTISEGVKIGDGSIIGANSFVRKDVPPYAIVVGHPAHILKYRFNETQINELMEIKWWNKDISWIRDNMKLFYPECIEELKKESMDL